MLSAQVEHGMTVRERFALEFANTILKADLALIEKHCEEDEAGEEQTTLMDDFYYTALRAVRMADTLAVALNETTPGEMYQHDDDIDYSATRPGVKEERIAECARDVNAAECSAKRRVFP